jgi:DNA-binding NtrC family response regulator
LAKLVEEGKFREDLYWRLNVLSLNICPLRQRKEDIPLLVEYFLERYSIPLGIEQQDISDKAIELLVAYDWPGNVRELQNCLYSAITIAGGPTIEPADLPRRIYSDSEHSEQTGVVTGQISLAETAAQATAKAERQAISNALSETGGNREKAAELLGIGRKTLYRKLRQYEME